MIGFVAPPAAAITVSIVGAVTPGYSAVHQTVSRLAVPGMRAAIVVQVAIGLTAAACFAIAAAVRQSRLPLIAAGVGLMVASLVRLDPASVGSTAGHRLGTGIAVIGLVAAAMTYSRESRVIGAAEIGLVLVGAALVPTSFDAWGVWERSLLALAMAWMMIVSARVVWMADRTSVSRDDMRRATTASSKSGRA